jgi:mannose-6-phosphate isomerase-like protein (cupin superfamily)
MLPCVSHVNIPQTAKLETVMTMIPNLLLLVAAQAQPQAQAQAKSQAKPQAERPMVVIDERTVMRDEPTPHGKIGMSTAYRISDAVPGRTMEFRKRVLHVGAAIGAHPLAHDEVYYVLSGEGVVTSGADTRPLKPGMAAYLYTGATVGIHQVGKTPLTLIVSYPVVR